MPLLSSPLPAPLGGDVDVDSVDAYARQFKQLLPPGVLWLFDTTSALSKTMLAIAEEFHRVDTRAENFVAESDPRTAGETLEDWERVLGLPDEQITEIPGTAQERQLAITQKLVSLGGQTAEYYIALAAACGYTCTVTDNFGSTVLRAGFHAGDRCYGLAWAYAWQLNVSPPSGTALTHAELESVINRAKPAHTTCIFNYL